MAIRMILAPLGLVACLACAQLEKCLAQEPESRPIPGKRKIRKSSGKPEDGRPGHQSRNRNRDRWKALSPEDREKLREIYRRLEKIPQEDRQRLLQRLRSMKDSERRKAIEHARDQVRRRSSPPHVRGKKAPGRRQRVPRGPIRGPRSRTPPSLEEVREMENRLKKSIDHWLQQFPPEVGERVKLFPRQMQAELFRRYRVSEILLRTFPGNSEREELFRLSRLQLRLLGRSGAEQPEGLTRESWERWNALKSMERRLIIHRLEELRKDRLENPPRFLPRLPGMERRRQMRRGPPWRNP